MDKRIVGIFLGLLAAGTLAGASEALAATTTTSVTGRMGKTAHGCLQFLTVNVGGSENCMYNGGPSFYADIGPYPLGESIGPVSQAQYYDFSEHPETYQVAYKPFNGDGKIQQVMTGAVTIDDNGTPLDLSDDKLSFTITLVSPGYDDPILGHVVGDIVRQLGNTNTATEDKYTSMTQVLAPHAVDHVTPNAQGGYDYVIGSQGFPTLLTFTDPNSDTETGPANNPSAPPCAGPGITPQTFGNMECGASFAAATIQPLRWTPWSSPASGRPGLGTLEGNIGAKTVGTVVNMACTDTGFSNACKASKVSFAPLVIGPNNTPGGGVTAEDVGWDELLLKVSTDSSGKITNVAGYDIQDYLVFGAPTPCGNDPGAPIIADSFGNLGPRACNSWLSSYFAMDGAVAHDDGGIGAGQAIPTAINVLANDKGFTDPVTVTVTTPPTQGTAVVTGASPGPAAGIRITYTPNAGATGTDTFVYTVADATSTDHATVTVNVLTPETAVADTAATTLNTPIDINVAKNDGFGDPATVTIDNSSFSNGGNATVTGNDGPPGDIVVHYTPVALPTALSYTETFTYTISDAVATSAPTTVTVSVFKPIPQATAGTLAISTQNSAPLVTSGIFCPPGPGAGASMGSLPSQLSITTQGAHGTAAPVDISSSDTQTCPFSIINAAQQRQGIAYRITDPTFWFGTDQFTYTITDNNGTTSSATVTVNVPNVAPTITIGNTWPIAVDQDHASTTTALAQFISFGNGARDQHTVVVTTPAAHGQCQIFEPQPLPLPPLLVTVGNGNDSLVYQPDAGYSGSDTCTLTVTDGDGQQASADALITVNPLITVTGSRSASGGALDPWTLGLLGALPLLRRGRFRTARRSARPPRRWHAAAGAAALAALIGASFGAWGAPADTAADTPAETAPAAGAASRGPQKTGTPIGEIVVTARGFEETLKTVPLAITAFDSDTIAAAGISSLGDVADMTPGLSFFNAFGEILPVPVIRGGVPTDIFGQNNTAIFVDGIYVSGREGLNFGMLDIDRIEVVKGPQSARYGRNAFFGAINYVIKKPSAEFESKVDVEYGNRGKEMGKLMFSGPILTDTLRYRVAFIYDDWNGSYNNSLSGNDIGGYRYRDLQASLYWQPVDDLEVNLGWYRANDRIDDPATVALPTNCEDQVNPPAGIGAVSGLPNINPTPNARLLNFCGEIPGIKSIPGLHSGSDPNGPLYGNTSIDRILQAAGEKRSLNRYSLKADWNLHDLGSVSSLTGYSVTNDADSSDFLRNLGYNQPFLYCNNASPDTPGNPNTCAGPGGVTPANQRFFAGAYNFSGGDQTEDISEELRYISPRNGPLRWTAGGYWYKRTETNYPGGLVLTSGPGAQGMNCVQKAPYYAGTGCLNTNNPISGNFLGADGTPIGMPPFDATAPDFAIGTAIFYGTMLPTGGTDVILNRPTAREVVQGWAIFSGLDFNITERLTARAEARLNEEGQDNRVLGYTPCLDKAAATVTACNAPGLPIDPYYNQHFLDPIYRTSDGFCNGLDGNAYAVGRCSAVVTNRFNMVTGRAGLDFQFTDDWMAYTSIAYGQKPGGTRLVQATVVCPDASVDPQPKGCPSPDGTIPTVAPNRFNQETVIAYELGLKGNTADRGISGDVSAFYNDWRQIVLRQLLEVDPVTGLGFSSPTGFNVNAGDASVFGIEIQSQVNLGVYAPPLDGLRGDFTFGWTRAKMTNAHQDSYARFPTFRADCGPQPLPNDPDPNALRNWWNACNQASGNTSGNTLLRQPEFKASASLSYRHQLVGDWEWSARTDVTYQSLVYIGMDNESWLPAHTYVNAKMGVRNRQYSVDLWVRNAFEDTGAIAAFRDIQWANTTNIYPPYTDQGPRPNFNTFVPYRYSVTYPKERTFGITAQVRFGALVK